MKSKKSVLIIFAFVMLLTPLGQLSTVYSQSVPQNIEDVSLAFLTQVYPLNFSHYNVTASGVHTLSSDPITTQSISYQLNSPDSNLMAYFLFQDGTLYSLSLSVVNGSVATARPYANLTDQAKDFLVKYQALSGADSKDLIQLLDQFDEGKSMPITLGNISFSVSHLEVPTTGTVTTSYSWRYSLNGADDTVVGFTFANNSFGGFFDSRQLYYVDSNEAINVAANYAVTAANQGQINNADIDRCSSVAEFQPMSQNGTLKPCWNVSLELNRPYSGGVSTLQMNVWADTGEGFNFNSAGLGSLQVNNSAKLPIQGVATIFLGATVGIALLLVLVATIAMWRRRKKAANLLPAINAVRL